MFHSYGAVTTIGKYEGAEVQLDIIVLSDVRYGTSQIGHIMSHLGRPIPDVQDGT